MRDEPLSEMAGVRDMITAVAAGVEKFPFGAGGDVAAGASRRASAAVGASVSAGESFATGMVETALPQKKQFKAVADAFGIFPEYKALQVHIDPNTSTLWCMTRADGPLQYSPLLVRELHDVADHIERFHAGAVPGVAGPKFLVTGSHIPSVYNLGGDLEIFLACVRQREREKLRIYAHECVRIVHRSLVNFNTPIVSIGLVQGDALGGGLEAALTFNFMIAEESARFGFPEVLFNTFPGMGAHSILTRRIGSRLAEQIIFSGKIYTAAEFKELGLVDFVVPDGEGIASVQKFIKQNAPRAAAIAAINESRRRYHPIEMSELLEITDRWVDLVMKLDNASLRKMEFLLKAQKKILAER